MAAKKAAKKAAAKKRMCGNCGKRQGHNAATCENPKKK